MTAYAQRPEVADPAAYRNKLKALLGERPRLDVLAETPARLRAIVQQHDAEVLRHRPFEGKWTPLEILGHLLDAELVFAYRTRTILCDERPQIVSMDQEKWVATQRYNEHDPRRILEDFAAVRALNLRLWRTLGPRQLGRVGVHSERGEEPLDTLLTMAAGHDLSHIDQITRYIAALRP